MALSIIEEIQIIRGAYGPKAATLKEIVEQAATGEIDDFYSTVKQVDASYYPLAAMYKTKMLGFIGVVASNTTQYTDKIIRIIVSNMAQLVGITIAQVNDATDAQWVGFVENEMLHSLEVMAGVLPEEKAEYTSSVYPAPTTTTTTTTETPVSTTTTTTTV